MSTADKRIATDMIKESGENAYTYMIEESGEKLYVHTEPAAYPVNLHGTLGANPFYFSEYLKRCGYRVSMMSEKEWMLDNYNVNSHDAYIALYFYTWGGHYQALIPNSDNKLDTYNLNEEYLSFLDYFKSKINNEGAVAISVYEIDR